MLPSDCEQFLRFVREREPVVPIPWNSNSPEIKEVYHPWWRTEELICLLENREQEHMKKIGFDRSMLFSTPANATHITASRLQESRD
jgi:hypothetical protein